MSETATLVRMSDTGLTLADAADDVRGKAVVDSAGDEVGEVDDLIIDEEERRVRLLQVGTGGFLGFGQQKVLVPVDAITSIDEVVHIGRDRGHVAGGPAYDPDLTIQRDAVVGLYDYYGLMPFWSAGYRNPGFPFQM